MTASKTAAHTTGSGELNWLLDDLVNRVIGIRKVLVLSGDGLPTGVSQDLTREDSEHLAAVASGFHSLAKGVGRRLRRRTRPADRRRARRGVPLRHRRGRRQLSRRPRRLRLRRGARGVRDDAAGQAGRRASGQRAAHGSARGRVVNQA